MGQIKCNTLWQSGLGFSANARGHKFDMDSKKADNPGAEIGPTPKEMLLASICGCSGMDVVSILQKMRVNIDFFNIEADTETTEGHPSIFKAVHLKFQIKSSNIKSEQAIKAVTLSMTKYCGVSAMVAAASPIGFEIIVNDTQVHVGQAQFSENSES